MAPGSCFFAPRNRTEAPGSKITPRAKTCIPRADRDVNKHVTEFMRVEIESLQITYDSWV
jgi:hypothetical protein